MATRRPIRRERDRRQLTAAQSESAAPSNVAMQHDGSGGLTLILADPPVGEGSIVVTAGYRDASAQYAQHNGPATPTADPSVWTASLPGYGGAGVAAVEVIGLRNPRNGIYFGLPSLL